MTRVSGANNEEDETGGDGGADGAATTLTAPSPMARPPGPKGQTPQTAAEDESALEQALKVRIGEGGAQPPKAKEEPATVSGHTQRAALQAPPAAPPKLEERRGPGRPPGSKNKPAEDNQSALKESDYYVLEVGLAGTRDPLILRFASDKDRQRTRTQLRERGNRDRATTVESVDGEIDVFAPAYIRVRG